MLGYAMAGRGGRACCTLRTYISDQMFCLLSDCQIRQRYQPIKPKEAAKQRRRLECGKPHTGREPALAQLLSSPPRPPQARARARPHTRTPPHPHTRTPEHFRPL